MAQYVTAAFKVRNIVYYIFKPIKAILVNLKIPEHTGLRYTGRKIFLA